MQPPSTHFRPISITAFIHSTRYIHAFILQNRRESSSSQNASAKLFRDAAKEETEVETAKKSSRLTLLEQEHENWTGDESIKDAVLRMLVDKYKPLRTGAIQTAEQKLKQAPLRVGLGTDRMLDGKTKPSTGSWATESLFPSSEGHQPWHTTFKVPTHHLSSVKHGDMPPLVSTKPSELLLDDRSRRLEKEHKKRTEQAGRLMEARESTMDYRMGIKGPRYGGIAGGGRRPNPVSVKGWTSLVEDKIEV
jgi:hypothetical protein